MAEITPAETLRSTAALIREAAGVAHAGPYAVRDGCGGLDSVVAVPPSRRSAEFTADTWAADVAFAEKVNARHLAGWTPEFAKEIADWLESTADDAESAVLMADRKWSFRDCQEPAGVESALNVARAYLGERS